MKFESNSLFKDFTALFILKDLFKTGGGDSTQSLMGNKKRGWEQKSMETKKGGGGGGRFVKIFH